MQKQPLHILPHTDSAFPSGIDPEQLLGSFLSRWQAEDENRISVEVVPKQVAEPTDRPPVFHHEIISRLYEYDYRLPYETIEEITALPSDTLISDLNAVVYDAIARYHIIKQQTNDDNYHQAWFLLHALFLLRDLKAEASLDVVLDFLSQSEDLLEFYLGDFIAEEMWSVLLACGVSQTERLFEFMKEPGRYCWSRSAAAEALSQMVLHDLLPRQQIIEGFSELITYFLDHRQTENLIDTDFNGSIIAESLDLQAKELLPLLIRMLEEKIANPSFAGDVEEVIKEINSPSWKHHKREISSIRNVYDDLRSMKAEKDEWLEPPYNEEEDEYAEYTDYTEVPPAGTYVNPSPKIGRNDPCPCGSGKKYKKCHGAG